MFTLIVNGILSVVPIKLTPSAVEEFPPKVHPLPVAVQLKFPFPSFFKNEFATP